VKEGTAPSIGVIRSQIAEITYRIAQIASTGSQPGDSRKWAERFAAELNKRYRLSNEELCERMKEVLNSLGLTEDKLEELQKLFLERCALSLEIARLKAKQATRLPKDRGELTRFVRRRDVEEGLVAEVLQKMDPDVPADRRTTITDFLGLMFEISRELQIIHLSEDGIDG